MIFGNCNKNLQYLCVHNLRFPLSVAKLAKGQTGVHSLLNLLKIMDEQWLKASLVFCPISFDG